MVRRSIALASLVLLAAGAARADQVTGWVLRAPQGEGYVIWTSSARVYPVLGPNEEEVGALRGRTVRVEGKVLVPPRGSRVRRTPVVVDRLVEVGPPATRVETVRGVVTRDAAGGGHVLVTPAGPIHLAAALREGPLPPLAQLEGRTLAVEGIVVQTYAPTGRGDVVLATARTEVIVERAPSLVRRDLEGTVRVEGDHLVLDGGPNRRARLYSTPGADVAPPGAGPLEDLLRRSVGARVSVRGWGLLDGGRLREVLVAVVRAQVGGKTFEVHRDGAALRQLTEEERRREPAPLPVRAEELVLDGARAPSATPGLVGSLR